MMTMTRMISKPGSVAIRRAVSDGIIIGALVSQICLLLAQDLHVVFVKVKSNQLQVVYTSK